MMVSSICKEKVLLQSQMWKECFNADIPQQKDQDTNSQSWTWERQQKKGVRRSPNAPSPSEGLGEVE